MNIHKKGSLVLKRYRETGFPMYLVSHINMRKALNQLKSHTETFEGMCTRQKESWSEWREKGFKHTLNEMTENGALIKRYTEEFEHFIYVYKVMYKPQIETNNVKAMLKTIDNHVGEFTQQMINSCYAEMKSFETACKELFNKCQWLRNYEQTIKKGKAQKVDLQSLEMQSFCEKENQLRHETMNAYAKFNQTRNAMHNLATNITDHLQEEMNMLYPECSMIVEE